MASLQTWHNMLQMKDNLELNRLNHELAASQDEVNILRDRMDKLERAREAKEKMLADDTEVFNGLFGPMVGGGEGVLLTSEERNEWLRRIQLFDVDRESVVNEFHKNLSEFVGEHHQ